MKIRNFKELVDRAYKEIKASLTVNNPYDFKEDYIDNGPNYSEICCWCGFPDYGNPASIYEMAINVAIVIIGHEFGTQGDIDDFLRRHSWL